LIQIKQLQQESFQISLEKQVLQELFDDIKEQKEKFENKVNDLYT